MKKIAMVGLYSIPNMGDVILCDTAKYLVHSIDPDIELRDVDVCPRYVRDYEGLERFKCRVSKKLKAWGEHHFAYENDSHFRYRYERFYWRLRLKNYYKEALRGVDAIIFCGGGFLKFRTQGLNYYVEMITEYAQAHHIPVMMNAVGIEGFDDTDIRCRKLREHINMDCVKVITTRDYIDILRDHYVTRPDIVTARVGDPALWTPECFGIQRDPDAKVVGINTIRGTVYQDYGNQSSPDRIYQFYLDLVREMEQRKIPFRLFSNGMKGDQDMAERIRAALDLDPSMVIPVPTTSAGFLEQLRKFSCVFGARLHACITAYSLGIPTVGLIWNEKTAMFAKIIGKTENYFPEEDLSAAKIADQIQASIGTGYDDGVRERIRQDTRSYMKDFLERVF